MAVVDTDGSGATAGTLDGGPGTLVVKERAIERVAVAAALSVPAVTRQVGGLSRLTGRDLPRADVSVGEHSVSVNLYIAVLWPSRISEVSTAVHDEVARVLDGIIGLPLHRLNVVVAATSFKEDAEHPVSSDAAITPPRPRAPTASPAALPVALVLAVALFGVAFVASREFLIVNGTIDAAPWIRNAVDRIAQLHWAPWMIGAAVAAVAAGVLLVVIGAKPRSRTHIGATSPSSTSPMVWLRPTDVARMCSDHAGTVPGIESARTTVTKRRVSVDVHRASGTDAVALSESVRDAIGPTLSVLADSRKVRVKVKESAS